MTDAPSVTESGTSDSKFKRYWQPILSTMGSIFGIISFVLVMTKNTLGATVTSIIVVFSFVAIAVIVGLLLRAQFKRIADELLTQVGEKQADTFNAFVERVSSERSGLEREVDELRKWPNIVKQMATVSLALRRIEHEARNSNNPELLVRERLRDSLVEIVEIFKATSGAECRVCIKMIYPHMDNSGNKKQAVWALGRSNTPYPERDRGSDFLTKNTDFNAIYFDRKSYWSSADIHDRAITPNYMSTSNELPYHSVIVWPLRRFGMPPKNTGAANIVDNCGDVIGFVCLDSTKKAAFSDERELKIGWWYVDLLAVVLDQLVDQELIRINPIAS